MWCESYLVEPWELVSLLILVYTHTTVVCRLEPHRMPDKGNTMQPLRIEGNYDYHDDSLYQQIYADAQYHGCSSLKEKFTLQFLVVLLQLAHAGSELIVLDLFHR